MPAAVTPLSHPAFRRTIDYGRETISSVWHSSGTEPRPEPVGGRQRTMSVYNLKLRSRPDGVVELRPGWGWRVVFLAITVIVVLVLLQEGQIRGLLPVIGLLTLIATAYREAWIFDDRSDLVESRIGVFVFRRVHRYRLSDLRSIRVRTRGQADPDRGRGGRTAAVGAPRIPVAIQRGYAQLILEFADEDDSDVLRGVVVQAESIRNRGGVAELAQELGRALDVPVTTRFG
jgi:hypothetical protein